VNGGRDGDCTDEPRQQFRHTNTNALSSVSHDNASRLLSVCTLPSKPPADGSSFSESRTRPASDIPLLVRSSSSGSAPSLPQPLAHRERALTPMAQLRWRPFPDASVIGNVHNTAGYVPYPAVSSFAGLPSIHFWTVPRSPRVPLSLTPPERVQISSIAGGYLEMTLYVRFGFRIPDGSRELNRNVSAA